MGLKFNIKPLPLDKLISSKTNVRLTAVKESKIPRLTIKNKKILQSLGYQLQKNA